MTTSEAATVLGVKAQTVTRYIERGLIAAVKHGRDYWIDPEEITRFQQQRRKPGQPRKDLAALPPKSRRGRPRKE